MKRITWLVILLVALNNIFAQGQIKTTLNPDTVSFAKPANLKIQLIVPKGQKIRYPELKSHIITKQLGYSTISVDTNQTHDKLIINYLVQIIPFKDSVVKVPSLPFQIGSNLLMSDSFLLYVKPIEIDTAQLAKIDTSQLIKIFDVTKPLKAPLTLKELWLRYRYVLFGLLLLVVLYFILRYLYKKYLANREKQIQPEETQLEPDELALERLTKLKDAKLYQQGKYKDFYSELSEILRQYVELRYHINALELTTSELETLLSTGIIFDKELAEGFLRVLKNADLVKFAKYTPLDQICEADLNFAFDFIEKTKPQKITPENTSETEESSSTNQQTENQAK